MSARSHRRSSVRRLRRALIQRSQDCWPRSASTIATSHRGRRDHAAGRTRVEIGDTISIRAESGALEDTKRPSQQSETATATSLGRALLRVRDRVSGGFGEAPPTRMHWPKWRLGDYCVGRLERRGSTSTSSGGATTFATGNGFSDDATRHSTAVVQRRSDVGRTQAYGGTGDMSDHRSPMSSSTA